jgi:hypothetical protein
MKACRPYRAKTKVKVERPYRYIREDFFLARSFRNLDDLNAQLRHWLDTTAIPRVHASTQRVVNEAFAEEKPHLKTLPLAPFRSVLKLERRVSHEGMVSVGAAPRSQDETKIALLERAARLGHPGAARGLEVEQEQYQQMEQQRESQQEQARRMIQIFGGIIQSMPRRFP